MVQFEIFACKDQKLKIIGGWRGGGVGVQSGVWHSGFRQPIFFSNSASTSCACSSRPTAHFLIVVPYMGALVLCGWCKVGGGRGGEGITHALMIAIPFIMLSTV